MTVGLFDQNSLETCALSEANHEYVGDGHARLGDDGRREQGTAHSIHHHNGGAHEQRIQSTLLLRGLPLRFPPLSY